MASELPAILIDALQPSDRQVTMQPRYVLPLYCIHWRMPQWSIRPISVSELMSPLSVTQVRMRMDWGGQSSATSRVRAQIRTGRQGNGVLECMLEQDGTGTGYLNAG